MDLMHKFTFLDTLQDKLYTMKYVVNLDKDTKEIVKNTDVYH